MVDPLLQGRRILVVEDEYMTADELGTELRNAGAIVIGPMGHLDEAVELIRTGTALDGAVLDINLHGDSVFSLADLLIEQGVPIVFSTGYERSSIPPRYAAIDVCLKPEALTAVIHAMRRAMGE